MSETHLWRLIESWRKRQRFAVSQAALARDIGVERSAVSQWKWGQATPSPENLRAIQSATGIRYRDLLDALLMDQGYLEGARDEQADQAPTNRAGGSPAKPQGAIDLDPGVTTGEAPSTRPREGQESN